MRPTGRLIYIVVLALAILAISQSTFAQKPTVPNKSTASPESVVDAEKSSEPLKLPADIQTRENFIQSDTDTKTLGPTAADYVRVLVGMVVVVLVIWGLSLLVKRFVVVKGLTGSSESLKVLYSLSLTPGRTLYMVRLADRILLIGAGEGGLRTLAEISDPAEVSAVLKELEFKGNFDLNPFRERLKSLMNAGDQDDVSDDDMESIQRRMKGTLDRLKKSGDPEEK
jgi:flagellar biogenesis protein FliO